MSNLRASKVMSVILLGLPIVAEAAAADKPKHVLMIDHVGGRFVYKLDNNIVPLNKLLDRLAETLTRNSSAITSPKPPGPTGGFVLMVHEKSTLSMIDNARGLITKAGYDWPKVFYFRDDKRYMMEIVLSRGVPFSPQGAIP